MTAINVVVVSGNLGKDPESRSTGGGTAALSFSLAVGERRKQGDEYVDHTNWVPVTLYGKAAEYWSGKLHKGQRVTVHGKLDYRQYTDKEGRRVNYLSVVGNNVDAVVKKTDDGQRNEPNRNEDDLPF